MGACFVSPVSASEIASNDESWFNVLDYCTPSSSNTVGFTGSNTYTFNSDTPIYYRTLDITILAIGKSLTGAYISYASGDVELTLTHLGSGVYRVYGDVGNITKAISITFTNDGSGNTNLSFVRFYASTMRVSHFDWKGDLYCNGVFCSTTSSAAGSVAGFTVTGNSGSVVTDVYVDDWQKFDYLDICLTFTNARYINSLIASFGDVYVPFTVSQYDHGTFSDVINIFVRLDLTGLDRTSTDPIVFTVTSIVWVDTNCSVDLNSVSGFVVTDLGNPVLNAIKIFQVNVGNWLDALGSDITSALTTVSKSVVSAVNSVQAAVNNGVSALISKLDDFMSSINPDSPASDEFFADSEAQASDLENALDQMDQVTKPSVHEINISVDGYIDSVYVSNAGALLARFLENDLILSMLMINLTIAFVSFIVFGKQG